MSKTDECPACAESITAYETKVGEITLLCEEHGAELDLKLTGIINETPTNTYDLDEIIMDLGAVYIAGKLKRARFAIEAKAAIEANYIKKADIVKLLRMEVVDKFSSNPKQSLEPAIRNQLRHQILKQLNLESEGASESS